MCFAQHTKFSEAHVTVQHNFVHNIKRNMEGMGYSEEDYK